MASGPLTVQRLAALLQRVESHYNPPPGALKIRCTQ